jgi:uncharacterized MAPEG superfamily protein
MCFINSNWLYVEIYVLDVLSSFSLCWNISMILMKLKYEWKVLFELF